MEDPSLWTELRALATNLDALPERQEEQWQQALERSAKLAAIKKRAKHLFENQLIRTELNTVLSGINRSEESLTQLLGQQAYQLRDWKSVRESLNYRRFFDINSLITMEAQKPSVFSDLHARILYYVGQGWVNGLRIDHVDGLYDPEGYLDALQNSCLTAQNTQSNPDRNFYLIVEKILEGDEILRTYWPVFGTTGYDYLNQVNALFVKKSHER